MASQKAKTKLKNDYIRLIDDGDDIIKDDALKKENQDQDKEEKRKKREDAASLGSVIISLLIKIGIIAGGLAALGFFVFNIHTSSGVAMDPAIKDRDIVISYRFDKKYSVRDVVVLDIGGERQVRRVVAVEGDTVDVTSEGLRVNGYLQQESYAVGETLAYESDVEYPVILGEGELFLLGDNRESSIDSRVYGPIHKENTIGGVITTIRRRDF